jgi:predicted regulator of Ras-like GTPase activity (Roadblock/LC7/MglB family)
MYQAFLESLLQSVKGAQAALLMDAEGEVVVEAGQKGERPRLIGAYQGLALTAVQKIAERCQLGRFEYLVQRREGGTVLLRPLKDGYYLVVVLSPEASVAVATHQSRITEQQMNEEL